MVYNFNISHNVIDSDLKKIISEIISSIVKT